MKKQPLLYSQIPSKNDQAMYIDDHIQIDITFLLIDVTLLERGKKTRKTLSWVDMIWPNVVL